MFCVQIGHAAAQTNVNTFILEVAINNTTPTEGQLQTYGLQIETAQGDPAPQGIVYWLNGTTILAQADLSTGTLINGNVTVRHFMPFLAVLFLKQKASLAWQYQVPRVHGMKHTRNCDDANYL